MDNIEVITAPMVNVQVTSNLSEFYAEKRFDRGLTIAELKGRLELITGASVATMTLDVYSDKNEHVCSISEDSALLGSYSIEDNYRIHVTDTEKKDGSFSDTAVVEKFTLPDEAYDKKTDSVRNFLRQNKLGKYDAAEMARIQAKKESLEKQEEEAAKAVAVGDRCEVTTQGEPTRRGVVMFVGKTHFKPGWWVGVKFDEPLGKNDGSVSGQRYFEAPMKYGGFTRPSCVRVGDFPELTYEEDEM